MGDNRHSAEEFELSDEEYEQNNPSDVESLFSEGDVDIESPVDGFFRSQAQAHAQAHAQAQPDPAFVQNSFVQAESESKAREAARQQAATGEGPSHFVGSPYRPQPPSTSHWQSHPQHNNDIAPPPDYQTAISDRSSQQASSRVTSPISDQASQSSRDYGSITQTPFHNIPNIPNIPSVSSITSNQSVTHHPNIINIPGLDFLRGNENERQWPFGNRGNPFSNPNFPFAAPAEPTPSQPTFGSTHPLVRNGLLGEHGSFIPRTAPESMTDYHRRTDSVPASNTFYQPREHSRRSSEPANEQSHLLHTNRETHRVTANHTFGNNFTWRIPRRSSTSKGRKGWHSACSFNKWFTWLIVAGVTVFLVLMASASYSAAHGADGNQASDGRGSKLFDKPRGYPGNGNGCFAEGISETSTSISFSKLKSFTLLELMERRSDGPMLLSGWIEVRPGHKSQANDLEMSLNVAVSKGWEVEDLLYTIDELGIEIEYPRLKRTGYGPSGWPNGCMSLGIVLKVRPGLELSDFKIDTLNCAINLLDGLFKYRNETSSNSSIDFQIHDRASLRTTSGNIVAEYLNARRTIIDSASGHVTGAYELLDLVDIHTTSGYVQVGIIPGDKDEDRPKPAELFVRSNSGSITVRVATDNQIPRRDYQTTIESNSGNIVGSYILGSLASFSSNSGTLQLEVLPIDPNVNKFYTKTNSGTHRIKVLSPYLSSSSSSGSSNSNISQLQSSHKSTSGSLQLVYPEEWTGKIDAQAISGSVRLSGEGVQTERAARFKHVIAHKGDGNSLATLRTTSGSIALVVGEEW